MIKINPVWPWSIGADSGAVHPTSLALVTCPPRLRKDDQGMYYVVDTYREAMVTTKQHAAVLMKMLERWRVLDSEYVLYTMADARDHQFIIDMLDHTRGIAGFAPIHADDMTPAELTYASIKKVSRLLQENRLKVNPKSPYAKFVRDEMATYVWERLKSGIEKPRKEEDDILDAIRTAVWQIEPPPFRIEYAGWKSDPTKPRSVEEHNALREEMEAMG